MADYTCHQLALLDNLIQYWQDHAAQCDGIPNRKMAERQKGWDLERVALLRKLAAAPQAPAVPDKDQFSPDWSRIEALESSLREHQEMVRSLQAVAVQQWISVSERKPDDPQDCMFYSDDLRNPVPMLIGLYIRGKFKCAGHEMVNVTHWAPLPAAPATAQPAPQAPLDVCTDPDNCRRCRAAQWDKHKFEHAGIAAGVKEPT